MILLIILIVLSYIPAYSFMSERFSAYEEYVWYQGINGSVQLTNTYPVQIKELGMTYNNKYSRFLLNKIDFENTLKNKNFFFDASLGLSYSDSFLPILSISPKIEFFLSENLEASVKVFLSNNIENSRGFQAEPFKEKIIAGFERGYIKYSFNKLSILFGRIDYHSSFSKDNSLLFDYSAPPMDGLYISGKVNNMFSYDFKYASLGSMQLDSTYIFEGEEIEIISRYLSFHKFIFSPKDYLVFSFAESCVFGRTIPGNILDYTFPFFVFYGEQNNISMNDNILWSFDINYNLLGKVNFSYSFLVDDYQYEYEGTKDLEPPELGHIIRIDAPLYCALFSLSYLRINSWVYNQMFPWNRYAFNDKNIGTAMGPDIQGFIIKAAGAYNESSRILIKMGYYEKGDNYSYSDWVFPIVDLYYYYTHIGIEPINKWAEFTLTGERIYKFLSLNLSLTYKYNLENTENNLSLESYIRISL
ncbi:MAG: hypothetical protein COX48_03660 [bacterium (Candidatus Stahlbacteria) CG23_combo_of_CG06-09_8_20_14_all_34_7]|nr:MAG: hypothetical protein COX48_03660 [bacterium (Candidatus Stahlbacteria) CG23_combo_of_CG06-09_8_20_14_all_34_7]